DAKRVLVLADRENAVRNGKVPAGDDRKHAGKGQSLCHIDAFDQRVRQMRTQDLAREHARQHDVVGKPGLPGTLRPGIDLAERLADDVEFSVTVLAHREYQPRLNADRRGSGTQMIGEQAFLFAKAACICVNPRLVHSRPYKLSRGSSIASPRIRAAANSTAS